MADVLRIKRRTSGAPGAPGSLANAELAYNEVDHTLYYGEGTGGAGGSATVVVPVGGNGMGSSALPLMNGAAAAGSAALMSRSDHIHPIDTTRAPLSSPTFTGSPNAPTPATADNSTSIATTAFVKNQAYATLANPVLTGDPQAPTPATADNDTSIATTAFVKNQAYAPLASPPLTGTPTAPTAPNGTNTTQIATTAYVLATRLDQMALPTADVSFNNRKLTGLADPVGAQDGATKNYVDNLSQGLDPKGSVRAASTGNLTLSGTQTVDGIALVANDRVLVKDQSTPATNGIYSVQSGVWTRTLDMDVWAEVPAAYVFVEVGTVNSDTGWVCTSDQGGTLGTTAITWSQFSGAGSGPIAGAGLTKTGNTYDVVGTTGRIIANADSIDIDSGYVGQTSIVTVGSITTGTWNANVISVARGGSGVNSLTGYIKGNNINPFTASATIPNTDISGLGTMSTQNASAVAITGGTIDGITFDGGTF